jgi:hypothetical protein
MIKVLCFTEGSGRAPLPRNHLRQSNQQLRSRAVDGFFAEDAPVNDQLREYWGKPVIREWAKRDIIGERLTVNVTEVINHYGSFIVRTNVDGNYDKRGLPDPLVLAFYFTVQSDLIVQLIILRNRYDI